MSLKLLPHARGFPRARSAHLATSPLGKSILESPTCGGERGEEEGQHAAARGEGAEEMAQLEGPVVRAAQDRANLDRKVQG